MSKLLAALLATALSAFVVAGSAHAAGYFRSGPTARSGGGSSGPTAGGGAMSGGGSFAGRPGGTFGGRQFFNRGPVSGGFAGGTWRGGDWRFRGGFRRSFGVVFVDPWYDPFWPYGYGFGWGWGWYGPPYYERRAAEYEYGPPPQDYGPPPEQYWYYCSNPDGYYPYVKSCNVEWQAVPATPPGGPAGPQNGPPPRTSALPENSPDAPGGGG